MRLLKIETRAACALIRVYIQNIQNCCTKWIIARAKFVYFAYCNFLESIVK